MQATKPPIASPIFRLMRNLTYRVCRSGLHLQKSHLLYCYRLTSPRMAIYRHRRHAQSANFAFGEGRLFLNISGLVSLIPFKIKNRPQGSVLILYKGYEKDIFAFFNKVSNSNEKSRWEPCISSMRSIVYHQRLAVVYHHCESEYSLRLMICTFGDEIHAKA